jgi:hypothetical protein
MNTNAEEPSLTIERISLALALFLRNGPKPIIGLCHEIPLFDVWKRDVLSKATNTSPNGVECRACTERVGRLLILFHDNIWHLRF